ncbi:MAG: hypothetical protein GF398_11150 [Chitinivibrionales bacterium]|nr:hypothetical protein [Chitinivibrionales bacterium]
MSDRSSGRKLLGNFFIKKDLQVDLIIRILGASLISTIISAGTIFVIYYLQHKSVLLYQMHTNGDLSKGNIFVVILPSLLISVIINLLLAFAIGLYASRKFAVPIYKLENWAKEIKEGKINTKIRFREHRQMGSLTKSINILTDDLKGKFLEIKKALGNIDDAERQTTEIKRISDLLSEMDLGQTESE